MATVITPGTGGKAAKGKDSAAAEESNLWFSFLKESSKRSHNQESTIIVVGDPDSGKKSLVQQICFHGREYEMEMNPVQKEIISYNYFDIDDQHLESVATVNMWMFGQHIFHEAFDIMRNVCATDQLMFLIVLDLSRPDDCLSSLTGWLDLIQEFCAEYHAVLSAAKSNALRGMFSEYNKSARLNKGDAGKNQVTLSPFKASEGNSFSGNSFSTPLKSYSNDSVDGVNGFAAAQFGLPIVVACCKADAMPLETADDMQAARELQARVRAICLEVGATLTYTSIMSMVNIAELKHYLMHRLYPDQISMELSLTDNLETTFVPAGFDTIDLINIGSGLELDEKKYEALLHERTKKLEQGAVTAAVAESDAAVVVNDSADATAASKILDPATVDATAGSDEFKPTVDLEDEQEWLKGLHHFIHQLSSTGDEVGSGGSGKVTPSHSETNLASKNDDAVSGNAATSTNGEGLVKKEGIAASGAEGRPPPAAARRANTATRRQSVRDPVEKKDVGDFFKNLLEKK